MILVGAHSGVDLKTVVMLCCVSNLIAFFGFGLGLESVVCLV